MKIIKQTLDKIAKIKKTLKKFLSEIVTGIIGTTGKINFRNLSRHCN